MQVLPMDVGTSFILERGSKKREETMKMWVKRGSFVLKENGASSFLHTLQKFYLFLECLKIVPFALWEEVSDRTLVQHEQGFRFNSPHHKNKQNYRTEDIAQW